MRERKLKRKSRKTREKWRTEYFSLPDMNKWLTWEEYEGMRKKFNKKIFTWEELVKYKETNKKMLKLCKYDKREVCQYDSCYEGCEIYFKKHIGFYGKCPNCNTVLEEENRCILCEWGRKKEGQRNRVIPKSVRMEVWRRDMGRCNDCGSKERLEFDHIIPFSKGGSNTARNIQLLCENCNRREGGNV